MHSIDAEIAGHAHVLDMKLQSLCGMVFLCLLCALRMFAKSYHLGVNWSTNTLRKLSF